MRLLVTGAGGILGQDLVRLAERFRHEVLAYDHDKLDVVDAAAVEETIVRDQPQAVIHCAAYTDVDGAETAEDVAHRVNADGAGNVARAATKAGARMIHVSSDYVFAGDEALARRESDATDPLSAYGRSKLQGERAVIANASDSVVIRSAWLYGTGGRNFVDTIAAKARKGEGLRVVDDQVGSPTWSVSLARAILNVLEVRHSGLLHFSNRGAVSWCGLARAIVEQLGLDVEVKPISSVELSRLAPRPAHSILDTSLYERLTGKAPRPWREALQLYLSGADDEREPPPQLDEV